MDVLSQLYFERLAKRAVMVAWKPAVEGILLLPRRPCSDSRMAVEASWRIRQGNMNSGYMRSETCGVGPLTRVKLANVA